MECDRIIPVNVLNDLCSRFIINVPEEERKDLIRICFQIENAHWFYLDFYCKDFPPNRKPCGIKEFALQIFNHIPFLQGYSQNIDKIIEDWKDYKFCVPTFGAILLDEDLSHVLLVQSYCSRSSWGFPKGKVNKDEPPHQCAIREVFEETGFDISHLLDPKEYIEANVNDQVVRLYIIPGVNKKEKFEPQTRYEIKAVNWFPICDIPLNKKDSTSKLRSGGGSSAFFLVFPFLRKLRQWIFNRNQRLVPGLRRQRHKSCGDIEYLRQRYSSSFDFHESVKILKNLKEQENKEVANIKKISNQNGLISRSNQTNYNTTMKDELSIDTTYIKTEQKGNGSITTLNHMGVYSAHYQVNKWTYDNQKYLEQTEKLRQLFSSQGKESQKSLQAPINERTKEKEGIETTEIFHIENMATNVENSKTIHTSLPKNDINMILKSNKCVEKKHPIHVISNKSDPTRNIFLDMIQSYSNTDNENGIIPKDLPYKCQKTEVLQSNDQLIQSIPAWLNFKFDTQFVIDSMKSALKRGKDV